MQCNVGQTDRIIRIVAGLVIIGLGFYFSSWWGALGLIPLVTGIIRWCPIYRVLHMSTCETPTVTP